MIATSEEDFYGIYPPAICKTKMNCTCKCQQWKNHEKDFVMFSGFTKKVLVISLMNEERL